MTIKIELSTELEALLASYLSTLTTGSIDQESKKYKVVPQFGSVSDYIASMIYREASRLPAKAGVCAEVASHRQALKALLTPTVTVEN